MPWRCEPEPETSTLDPLIRERVLDLATRDRVGAVRLLRQEAGLPLESAVRLVDSWQDGRPS